LSGLTDNNNDTANLLIIAYHILVAGFAIKNTAI